MSMYNSRHNSEGYLDMTAYLAIRKVDRERKRTQNRPLGKGRAGKPNPSRHYSERAGCKAK